MITAQVFIYKEINVIECDNAILIQSDQNKCVLHDHNKGFSIKGDTIKKLINYSVERKAKDSRSIKSSICLFNFEPFIFMF